MDWFGNKKRDDKIANLENRMNDVYGVLGAMKREKEQQKVQEDQGPLISQPDETGEVWLKKS